MTVHIYINKVIFTLDNINLPESASRHLPQQLTRSFSTIFSARLRMLFMRRTHSI